MWVTIEDKRKMTKLLECMGALETYYATSERLLDELDECYMASQGVTETRERGA